MRRECVGVRRSDERGRRRRQPQRPLWRPRGMLIGIKTPPKAALWQESSARLGGFGELHRRNKLYYVRPGGSQDIGDGETRR